MKNPNSVLKLCSIQPADRKHGQTRGELALELPVSLKNWLGKIMLLALPCAAFTGGALAQSAAPDSTTAWHDGKFQVDVAGVLGRSSIVLGQPNVEAGQAMPLGNGNPASGWKTAICAPSTARPLSSPILASSATTMTFPVPAGDLQSGVVWDYLRLELDEKAKAGGAPEGGK